MSEQGEGRLRRVLGLTLLTFYGLGTILGAGIYVLVGKIAGEAGMLAPAAFIAAAAIAALTAFSYAELSARLPKSAGEAIYIQHAFGLRWLSVAVGLLLVLAGTVSSATLANGSAGYLRVFIALPDALIVIVLVGAIGLLAIWGIAESAAAAAIATLFEIAGLLLVVAVAHEGFATLPQRLPELVPPFEAVAWGAIASGAFLAFFAFIGFEDMVNVAEEVKDPQRTLPRAILLAMGIATVLYLLVVTAAVLAVPPAELAETDAPLALVYERMTGRTPTAIALIGLFAVLNGALVQVIMGARILYGMSAAGWLPRGLSQVHAARRTPHIATVVVVATVLVLALWLPLVTLARTTSYIVLVVFALIHLALVQLKRREPSPPGVRPVPLWIPWTGFVFSVAMIVIEAGAL